MARVIYTFAERPELIERRDALIDEVWPEFMNHGDVVAPNWGFLEELFPEFQFVLYDEDLDAVIGSGNTILLSWDGTLAGLAEGIDDVMVRTLWQHEEGKRPDSLSALQATVQGQFRGAGLSGQVIQAMRELAGRSGFHHLIAPVRPTWKARYPLIPIEWYMQWTRSDGMLFDPWLRILQRVGGEVLRAAPESMLITGTVWEWEAWTGMAFPQTGEYIVPEAVVPVSIDRDRDVGRYVEPNVWMRHEPNRQ